MDAEERARKLFPVDVEGIIDERGWIAEKRKKVADALRSADSAAYRRGVEDAARVARSHGCSDQTCQKCVGGAVEAEIRALVEKEDG